MPKSDNPESSEDLPSFYKEELSQYHKFNDFELSQLNLTITIFRSFIDKKVILESKLNERASFLNELKKKNFPPSILELLKEAANFAEDARCTFASSPSTASSQVINLIKSSLEFLNLIINKANY